jgi:hypothetical protein
VTLDEDAEADDTVGAVRGSFLKLAADVLAAPGRSLLGLADQTEPQLENAGERFDLIRWPSSDHLSLAWDPGVHELVIRNMLAQKSPDSQRPDRPPEPPVEMPTDPLAIAQAKLRSGTNERSSQSG